MFWENGWRMSGWRSTVSLNTGTTEYRYVLLTFYSARGDASPD